ncbi:MAG: hypothetical protein IPF98_04765 [Gemmatimonadetes bacterium]|nr:hypothetical protein [Gemmatimonadota bacterium]
MTLPDLVAALATSAGARTSTPSPRREVDEGTDTGSNSVVPIMPPQVALLGGSPVSGNAFGFAW